MGALFRVSISETLKLLSGARSHWVFDEKAHWTGLFSSTPLPGRNTYPWPRTV